MPSAAVSTKEEKVAQPQELEHQKYSVVEQFNQALSGAIAGGITRSVTQPLDVLKVRLQLQVEPVGKSKSAHGSKYTSLWQTVRTIYGEEGLTAFWKGHNSGQYMTILYTIVQFWSYEQLNLRISQTEMLHNHHNVTHFISGGLAGCMSGFVSTPFDVIRTRIIAQDPGGVYTSTLVAFRTILRSEGVRGLFRGLGPTLLQIAPQVGANFMIYKRLNEFATQILETSHGPHLPTWCLLLTGGISGVTSKAVIYPMDFIKKRLQMRGFEAHRKTYGRNQQCRSTINCIQLTLREEGLLAFYKGIFPTLLKSGICTALYFSMYDIFKALLFDH